MLGRGTPPGTLIVTVWDSSDLEDYISLVHPEYREYARGVWANDLPGLSCGLGVVMSLIETIDCPWAVCGYVVRVSLYPDEFLHPKHFARAVLPASLTSLLLPSPELEDS